MVRGAKGREKIENLGYVVKIDKHQCIIKTTSMFSKPFYCLFQIGTKVESTYQAIVHFIEFYNETNKNSNS